MVINSLFSSYFLSALLYLTSFPFPFRIIATKAFALFFLLSSRLFSGYVLLEFFLTFKEAWSLYVGSIFIIEGDEQFLFLNTF